MERAEVEEAVAVLRRFLGEVGSGGLDPGGATGVALVRRLEGAVAALEALLDLPDDESTLT